MYLFGVLALVSGLILLYLAVQDWILFGIFLGFGLTAIWASISYTSGSNPYGYAGLGDISVFIFFGLLGVYGTYFLHSLAWDDSVIWIGIALGLFSAAVLNINNIRDIESDTTAGKRSIPVRIGKKAAIIYNWFLILGGNYCLLIFAFITQEWTSLVALAVFPLMIRIGINVQRGKNSQEIDPNLKKMALSTLVWVILYGIGLVFLGKS